MVGVAGDVDGACGDHGGGGRGSVQERGPVTTGSRGNGCRLSSPGSWPRGRRRSNRARGGRTVVRGEPVMLSRMRSSSCARNWSRPVTTPAPRRSPGTCVNATARRPRWPRSGECCPAAGSSFRNRTSDPARPGAASPPNFPTSSGKPTSPTGSWSTARRWRSSTSSTTTPGCSPVPPHAPSSKPATWWPICTPRSPGTAAQNGCSPTTARSSPVTTAATAGSLSNARPPPSASL
jgi:hypothetical protein